MKYKYKLSCSKDKLKEVREFVNNVLTTYSLPEVEIHKLVLAIDEICANLIIHSHQCNPKEFIELSIKVKEKEGIVFEISDKGVGFNICKYNEPSLNEIIKEKKKGGIGLMLVKRIVDDIEFISANNHNVCRLYKRINPIT